MAKEPKKEREQPSAPSPKISLRNPGRLVVCLDPMYDSKFATVHYTPHGWIGVNRITGAEELLPREALKLYPLSELITFDGENKEV